MKNLYKTYFESVDPEKWPGCRFEKFPTYTKRIYTDGHYDCYDDNDRWHCPDGPAITYSDGRKFWFKHGVYHNLTGPSAIHTGNFFRDEYAINGKPLSKAAWQQVIDSLKDCKTLEEKEAMVDALDV